MGEDKSGTQLKLQKGKVGRARTRGFTRNTISHPLDDEALEQDTHGTNFCMVFDGGGEHVRYYELPTSLDRDLDSRIG